MTGYSQTLTVCIDPLPDRFLFNQKEFHKDKNNCFELTLDPNKENFMEVFKSGYNTQRRYLTNPTVSKLEFQLTRTYYDSKLNMEFILVPPGKFLMGYQGPDLEKKAHAPLHLVQITEAFYLGKTEVTQSQWRMIMKTDTWKNNPQYQHYREKEPIGEGPNYPVSWLSWHDTQKFIAKANMKAGSSIYRLASEAEFEYAARSGGSMNYRYIFGDDPKKICLYGNVADQSFKKHHPNRKVAPCDDGFPFTAPVMQFRPNAWGFYDMLGNLWSWVDDWYDPDYYTKSPSKNPRGPREGRRKSKRGGCYFGNHEHVAVGDRFFNHPSFQWVFMGLRLFRSYDPNKPLPLAHQKDL